MKYKYIKYFLLPKYKLARYKDISENHCYYINLEIYESKKWRKISSFHACTINTHDILLDSIDLLKFISEENILFAYNGFVL